MKKVPFLRSEFVWGLLRLIDEFKIISLSSDFGFITSSSALHLCVHQGSADQVDIRWSLRTRRVQLGLNQTAKIYYSIFISILFFLNEGSNERKNGFHGIDDSKVHAFDNLFWKQLSLHSQMPNFCQTPYIGFITKGNWLPFRDFILWENQIKFNWGRLGSIWETSLF